MKPEITTLANGLRVLPIPILGSETVTVLVLVKAGSRYETPETNGLSHFLEHMCFKGTPKRPSAFVISNELESIGAISNAFTGQEVTGYFAKGLSEHFEQITDVISDIYQNSLFPEGEIEKEKGVIIEEINMYEDIPQALVEYDIYKLMFGDTPLGWRIGGFKEVVSTFTRENLIEYYTRRYIPEETLLVMAGNVTTDQALELSKKYFATLDTKSPDQDSSIEIEQTEPRVSIRKRVNDQTYISIGFRAFSSYDPRLPVLEVLAGVLAHGMASRLFQILREEMGACYYVNASVHSYREEGFLEISAGVDTKRLHEVIARIYAECQKLKTELVSEAELSRVKEYNVGSIKLGLESSNAQAMFYGEQAILKKPLQTPSETADEIRKVTPEALQTLAGELFRPEHTNLVIVGPEGDENALRSIFV